MSVDRTSADARQKEPALVVENPLTLQVLPCRALWLLFLICLGIEVSLVVLDGVINYGEWVKIPALQEWLNTASERALPAWVAVTQTWMVALTLGLVAAAMFLRGGSKWSILGWVFLTLFFAFMSMDDGTAFHERLGSGVENRLSSPADPVAGAASPILGWFPSYGWQLALGPFFLGSGLFMVVFLWKQFRNPNRFGLVMAGLALMAAAVGLDFIEGLDRTHPWNIHVTLEQAWGLDSHTVRHFSKSFEEFLEMFGTTLLWVGFLGHFMSRFPALHLDFRAEHRSPVFKT